MIGCEVGKADDLAVAAEVYLIRCAACRDKVGDAVNAVTCQEDETINTKAACQHIGTLAPCQFIIAGTPAPIILIVLVLVSILFGVATPTESASVGAIGAAIIAYTKGELTFQNLKETSLGTVKLSSFVFVILIGASMFSLVFRGFGGDEMIEHFLGNLPGGLYGALFVVMIAIFLLGFFLDYIEIIFVIVPLVGPVLIAYGADPLWLGILISLNLQTSFLTPPFGFSLFFLRGVAPKEIKTKNIYRGVIPYIGIQVLAIFVVGFFPSIATWLPRLLF